MAYSQDTRLALRGSYIYERLPLKAAASRHQINIQTARRWKQAALAQGDDWDKARAAGRVAAGGIAELTAQLVEDFALLFQATVEQIKQSTTPANEKAEALARLSDAYTKMMAAAAKGSPKLAELAVVLKVLEELTEFIRQHYPQDLPRFSRILEPFGQHINQVFK